MKVVDFFHFPIATAEEERLFKLTVSEMKKYLSQLENKNVNKYVIPIFSSKLIKENEFHKILKNYKYKKKFRFLYMPDLNKNIIKQISVIKKLGFVGIVIHPYIQEIDKTYNHKIDTLINECENHKLFISICSAYGGSKMYKYFPLEIVSYVAERFNREIIIIHGGGLKIMEALLLAESYKNIYLETSFSLNYWAGSNILLDYSYAFKKIGSKRIIFGSDNPFMQYEVSKKILINILKNSKFSNTEIANIFFNNANHLLLKYE